jgi:hypothetical protein
VRTGFDVMAGEGGTYEREEGTGNRPNVINNCEYVCQEASSGLEF